MTLHPDTTEKPSTATVLVDPTDGPAVQVRPGARRSRPTVTAVLVAHDGAGFLPRTLDAVESQTHRPDVLIGVDTGSEDGGGDLLAHATTHLLRLRRDTSFGDGVRAALTTLDGHALQPLADPRGDDQEASDGGDAAPSDGPAHAATPRRRTGGTSPEEPLTGGDAAWIWLLHDDSAPAPDALELLLDVVDRGPSIGIAGCKQVGWEDSRRLLEVGWTVSPLGARVTGVDTDDIDQGQLDHRSDVLAVDTAGMLIRRDVWDRLGGPDPALTHARADLDLCRRAHLAGLRVVVVPQAAVAHADAGRTGRRAGDDGRSWARRDRRAALHLRLVAAPWPLVPLLVLWLAGAAVLRALGRLALKQPERAAGEFLALLGALNPVAWWIGRRRARAGQVIRRRDLRRLSAGPRQVLRQRRDAFAAHLRNQEEAWGEMPSPAVVPDAPAAPAASVPRARGTARTPDGIARDLEPDDPVGVPRPQLGPDGEVLPPSRTATLARPLLALAAVTGLATAVGLRLLLSGTGQATGPALLPMPSAARLWDSAWSGWRPTGLGVPAAGDPMDAVLALLAWVLGGSTRAATDVLLLGALPLAAFAAWWAAGTVTRSIALRTWAALAWAAFPTLLLSLATGRIGAVLAHVVLPPAMAAIARVAGAAGAKRSARVSIMVSSAGGLALTVLLAAAPALAVPVVIALLVASVRAAVSTRHGRLALAWLTAVPAVLLLPWWAQVARTPALLVAEPGGPTATSAELAGAGPWPAVFWPIDPARLATGPVADLAADVARLLAPVFPPVGTAGVLRGAGIVLALPVLLIALGAVLVRREGRGVAAGVLWGVGLAALALAVVAGRLDLGAGPAGETRLWPGALVSLFALAVLGAALCRLDGAAARLRRRSLGWRHLGAVATGAVVVLVPLLSLAGWAADGWSASPDQEDDASPAWVHRTDPDVLPVVAAAEADGAAATRSLVLQVGSGGVRWAVYRSGGPRTGDWSAAAAVSGPVRSGRADAPVLTVIGQLLSNARDDARRGLSDAAIGSVLLLPRSDAAAAQALDTAPGLVRTATTDGAVLWRVELAGTDGPTRPARARVVDASGASVQTLASDGAAVRDTVRPGPAGRTLVLAERADPGWRAELDGRRLTPGTYAGWAQSFRLPAGDGQVEVSYDDGLQATDLARLAVAGIAVLGAIPLPGRRRRLLPPPARLRRAAPEPLELGPPTGRRALVIPEAVRAAAAAKASADEGTVDLRDGPALVLPADAVLFVGGPARDTGDVEVDVRDGVEDDESPEVTDVAEVAEVAEVSAAVETVEPLETVEPDPVQTAEVTEPGTSAGIEEPDRPSGASIDDETAAATVSDDEAADSEIDEDPAGEADDGPEPPAGPTGSDVHDHAGTDGEEKPS